MPRRMEEVYRDIRRVEQEVEKASSHTVLHRLLARLDQLEAEWLTIGADLGFA